MIATLCPRCKTLNSLVYVKAWLYNIKVEGSSPIIDFETGKQKVFLKCESCGCCMQKDILDLLVDIAVDNFGNISAVIPVGSYWKGMRIDVSDIKTFRRD